MKHRPTKLALLISLIGAGVSPYAFARADVAPEGLDAQDTGLTEAHAQTALDRTRWSPGLVWRTSEDEFDGTALPKASAEFDLIADDRAPGEGPTRQRPPARRGDLGIAKRDGTGALLAPSLSDLQNPDASATVVAQIEPIGSKAAKARTPQTERRRVKRGVTKLFQSDPHTGVTRRLYRTDLLVRAPRAEFVALSQRGDPTVADHIASAGEANTQTTATAIADDATHGFIIVPPTPSLAPAISVHADQLMASLAAIVLEDVTPLDGDPLVADVSEQTLVSSIDQLAATEPPSAEQALEQASAARVEPREIVVATQADKVLRSLGAILSDDRDEVGAIRPDILVDTQADKVLEALRDTSSAHKHVEDGEAKRVRKLNAAKLNAEAAEATEVAETVEAAEAGTLVTLTSAEAPAASTGPELSFIPIETASRQQVELDIDLTQPVTSPVTSPVLQPVKPSVAAEPAPLRVSPFGSERVAVSEASLDGVRGGFVTDNLNISFGIERAVYINGALVTTTSLNLSDLGRISAGRGSAALDSATVALIQNGAGNIVSTGSMSSASIGTVVQNTLDGQKIQSLTVINASVNSLGVLRGLNLQSSMRGAVIDSLRR